MKFFPVNIREMIAQKVKSQSIATAVSTPIITAGANSKYPAWQVAGVATLVGYAASYAAAHYTNGDTPVTPSPATLSGVFSANVLAVKAMRVGK